jgi:hypothetical protein
MSKASKFDSFMAQFKHRRSVRRPIAADVWTFTDASGKKRRAELTIGKPRRVPGEREWYCEVRVSGWVSHVIPAIGIGPLDSLDNSMKLVRRFQEYVGDLHIARLSGSRSRRRG